MIGTFEKPPQGALHSCRSRDPDYKSRMPPAAGSDSSRKRALSGRRRPLGAADLQRRLDELELATVSAVRALQMDVEGDPGVPSATVLRKARQAIR
jgi:hypothetical protein